MGKRLSHEEYVEKLKENNPNLEVLGRYINASTKIPHRCIKHDIIFDKVPYNALKGEGCKLCANEKIGVKLKKTHEQYIDELKNTSPNIEVLDIYKGASVKLRHRCTIHDYIWEAVPSSITHGTGCPICGIEKQVKSRTKTQDQYIEELSKVNGNIEVLGEYINANVKILHRCKIHNYEWMVAPGHLLFGQGCPKCKCCYKRTHEDYVNELKDKNPNLVVVGEYIGARIPILHRCIIHNYEWSIAPSSALAGNVCPMCKSEVLSKAKSKTHEQYIEELHKVHPDINPIEQYKGANTKIKHECNIDGYVWSATPACVVRHNCPRCAKRVRPTQDEYEERLYQVNPSIEVIGEYKNMSSKIMVRCKVDGHTWESNAELLLRGIRCPVCGSKSLGEIMIKEFLDKHNIKYEYQKRFKECKLVRPLAFDFYIPESNTCIEYDGIQHFEPIDFAGRGEKWANGMFAETQKRDQIKTDYCKENKIKLIRIPYFKNAELELENLLFT